MPASALVFFPLKLNMKKRKRISQSAYAPATRILERAAVLLHTHTIHDRRPQFLIRLWVWCINDQVTSAMVQSIVSGPPSDMHMWCPNQYWHWHPLLGSYVQASCKQQAPFLSEYVVVLSPYLSIIESIFSVVDEPCLLFLFYPLHYFLPWIPFNKSFLPSQIINEIVGSILMCF